ncbi:hypothetical protein SK128_020802, partial [Halocaridina rubra]
MKCRLAYFITFDERERLAPNTDRQTWSTLAMNHNSYFTDFTSSPVVLFSTSYSCCQM